MSWQLKTATGRYVVDLAADHAGPVLQDWTSGPVRGWQPSSVEAFETPVDRLPLEYSALGSRHVRGSDLIVQRVDGAVGARLSWPEDVLAEQDGDGSRFTARAVDETGELEVLLQIETSTQHDVVSKGVTLTNVGPGVLELPRAFGPAWELPIGPGARVDYLAGVWSREFTPYQVVLPAGELTIGSRTGTTSHGYSPTIRVQAIDAQDGSPCFGLALAWSGSWRLLVDAPPFRDRVRVAGGVDDESGVIRLAPGESFRTPAMLGLLAADADGVRRGWHHYQRSVLARGIGLEHRPIVYNSWYATTFDVRLDHQAALAQRAADLGAEVFVVDDGWFAGRVDDRSGLGDWWPDPAAFPGGLGPLIEVVVRQGMRFGIWVEPEAVNPDSELYRAHPDWVYRAGTRPLVQHRNQYVLDFGRPEVVDWTIDWLRSLLADRRISYLKWDMNRPISDGGRPGDPYRRQWAVRHVEGYYTVLRMLREEFPHVTVEGCAGGGGRIDAGGLALTDVVWPSDETGPRDRLAIQHGFLSAWSPHLMSSWVTDEPDRIDSEPASLEFRFVVAMAGVLGIGADLLGWTPQELQRARDLVRLYRRIRTTVHAGQVELHGSPRDSVYAVEYGTPERTVMLVWARSGREGVVRLSPRFVTIGARYHVAAGLGEPTEMVIDEAGVEVPFSLAADTEVLVLEPVP